MCVYIHIRTYNWKPVSRCISHTKEGKHAQVIVFNRIFFAVWLKGAGWALCSPHLLGTPESMLRTPDRSERSEPARRAKRGRRALEARDLTY